MSGLDPSADPSVDLVVRFGGGPWLTTALLMEAPSNGPWRKRSEGLALRQSIDNVSATVRGIDTRVQSAESRLQEINVLANNVSSILMPAGALIDCVPTTYPVARHPSVPRHWAHGWLPYNGRAANEFWYRIEHVPQLWMLYQKTARSAEDLLEVGGVRFIRVRDYSAPVARLVGATSRLVFAGNAVPQVFVRGADKDGAATMQPVSLYA